MRASENTVGAAQFTIDEDTLGRLLNLPEGVYVASIFPTPGLFGKSLGFVIWTEKEGILPPKPELGVQVEDISHRFRFEVQTIDGKRFYRAVGLPEWDVPDGE